MIKPEGFASAPAGQTLAAEDIAQRSPASEKVVGPEGLEPPT